MREYLTIAETARRLACSRTHVYNLIARGVLSVSRNPAFRKGGPVRISRAEVTALLDHGLPQSPSHLSAPSPGPGAPAL